MITRNDPTSCNDLIITLLIAFILVITCFLWLYDKNEQSADLNQTLALELKEIKISHERQLNTIKTLNNDLNDLQSNQRLSSTQYKNNIASIEEQQVINQQQKSTLKKENKNLLDSVFKLKNILKEQKDTIKLLQKDQSDVKSQLIFSKQNLVETRMLSEQQFNEFKQLKHNYLETRIEAEQRLKEVNEWQIEVEKLKKQLVNTKIKMSQPKQRYSVFEMEQDILFNKGEASLKADGKQALDTLANIFKQYPNRQIAIQGHSDNQPLGTKLRKKYNSNWELAAARAASAIYYLQNKKSISPNRIILVSYANYRPKSNGNKRKDFAENRRIEITLMPKNFDFVRGKIKPL